MKLKFHNEKRKINDLIPYESNPRKLTEKQFDDLKKSLEKFDLAEIPVIDIDNKIVAGHQRLVVLKALGRGEEEIDVRIPSRKLTEEEFQEYLIRSNKNTGQWDWDMLGNVFDLEKLQDWGFDDVDLGKIPELYDENDKDDLIPELQAVANSKIGDIYQLGEHRIMCGSSTNTMDVEKLMNGKIAKTMFTSPPYNMGGKMYNEYEDNLEKKKYVDFNIEVIKNYSDYLKGFLFWNISYNKNTRDAFIEIAYKINTETKFKFMELICWNKKHAMPITSKQMVTRQYEDIFVFGDDDSMKNDMEYFVIGRNDEGAFFNKRSNRGLTNYWEIGTNKTQLDNHKACYPVAIPAKGIQITTKEGDIVIDPFLGSGSTLIACEKTGRICYGMEIDCRYCDVIVKRWEDYTGKKSVKVS